MSPIELTVLIFGSMLVMMAIRVPIAVSMFGAGTLGYVVQTGWLPFANFLNTQAFARFASYDLSVIPLFILMGQLRHQGRHQQVAVRVCGCRDGALQGRAGDGLAAGLRGLRRDQRLVGGHRGHHHQVALPEMRRHGYSGRLATGTLAAGGTLGILMPPSVPLVIYAILTEQNISQAVRRGDRARHHRDDRLHDRSGDLRATGAGPRAQGRRCTTEIDSAFPAGGGADRGHLRSGFRRHLWRLLHANRRRSGGCRVHLPHRAGQG